MNKNVRKALIVILAVVFVVSVARLGYQQIQYRQNAKAQEEAQSLAALSGLSLPDRSFETAIANATAEEVDPYAEVLQNMDFKALQEVNSEVIGWILIPDTIISYPLLQGANNQYYLNHSWKRQHNLAGSIFLEHTANRALTDFNTIIYGHRMNDGSMFSTLSRYKNLSYWQEHPYVYVTDDEATRRYQIFAAWEAGLTDAPYQLGLTTDRSKQAFIDACVANSVIDTGVVPQVYDKVLTLSTCTGHGHATRWVVQAVCPGTPPAETVAPAPTDVPEPTEAVPTEPDGNNRPTEDADDAPEENILPDDEAGNDPLAENTPPVSDDETANDDTAPAEDETIPGSTEPIAVDEATEPEDTVDDTITAPIDDNVPENISDDPTGAPETEA